MVTKQRKVVGFASKPTKAGGKSAPHIHAICEDGHALCDKRMGAFSEVSTFLKEVTCTKCANYQTYKHLMENFQVGDAMSEVYKLVNDKVIPPTKEDGTVKEKEKPVKKEKEKPVKKEKAEPEQKQVAPPLAKDKKIKKPIKYPPKGPAEKRKGIKSKETPAIVKRQDWNLLWSEDKAFCDILHKPTQMVLFEAVKSNVALYALDRLNDLKVFWESETAVCPDEFVPTIRTVIAKAYNKMGISVPIDLTGAIVVEQEKRKIKRRQLPKRQIKRRPPEQVLHPITKIFGCRMGSKNFRIVEMLNSGKSLGDMIEVLQSEFEIKTDKARKKVKAMVRKTARKKGISIIIKLNQTAEDDLYGLAEVIDLIRFNPPEE